MNAKRRTASLILGAVLAACGGTPTSPPAEGSSPATPPATPLPAATSSPLPLAVPTAAPTVGTWVRVDDMSLARWSFAAIPLLDGRVLVVGDGQCVEGGPVAQPTSARAELFDPATGHWSPAEPLNAPREGFAAVRLPDGRVLVTGGVNAEGVAYSSTKLFDPSTGHWSNGGLLNTARWSPAIGLLPDGRVLVAGGDYLARFGGRALASAEVYDPRTDRWTQVGPLHHARSGGDVVTAPGGRVRIVDGTDPTNPETELFDPRTGRWTTSTSMPSTDEMLVARLWLSDGSLLSIGGAVADEKGGAVTPVSTVSTFDPATGRTTTRSPLPRPRIDGSAVELADGRVLVAGGTEQSRSMVHSPEDAKLLTASTLTYDAARDAWSALPSMPYAAYLARAVLLADGSVLVVGGYLPPEGASTGSCEPGEPIPWAARFIPAPAADASPTPVPEGAPVPTPTPEDPVVGRMAAVVTDTRLAVRTAPGAGSDSKVLDWYLYPRQRAEVLEGPALASGYLWYRVRVNQDSGWVVGTSGTGQPSLAVVAPDRAIDANDETCLVTGIGGVTCWGGTGSIQDSYPDEVAGLAAPAIGVARGDSQTCLVEADGIVACSFANATPVEVAGLSWSVTAITAGRWHICALTSAGGVECWGENPHGQLGDGTTTRSTSPVQVAGLSSGVVAIAAGNSHTCALTGRGGVKCWGRNDLGQLGDGTAINRPAPADVVGLAAGVGAIAAGGQHSCAVTSAGGVKCWGKNRWGEIGDGTANDTASPVDVAGLSVGARSVAAGELHTCAVTTVGAVTCWGYNGRGQVGSDASTHSLTPVGVPELSRGVTTIAAGWAFTCALTSKGEVKCWGDNSVGELGAGPTPGGRSAAPIEVDFGLHQSTTLRPYMPHTIAQGETVVFTATVHPLPPAGGRAVVRFVVRRADGDAWVLVDQREVTTDVDGRAQMTWTFAKTGSWSVGARAVANEWYAESMWAPWYHCKVARLSPQ